MCNDDAVNASCTATGTCTTCHTFNQADIDHIKSLGWNSIRLGVVWAGAQPRDEDALDPEFLRRLHAVLNLTDANGLHVVLDNHGDMVGSLGCGNGAPAWFQMKAPGVAPLVGKPLSTGLPYSLISSLNVKKVGGYDHCGDNATKWAAHAGDPNYNLLNECCQAMNGGNPAGLGYHQISQKTMDYMVDAGAGRDAFVRFWRLMAEAVATHPSAFAFELSNEPMTIKRGRWYETARACTEAITQAVPDASVSVCDTGEGVIFPSWASDLGVAGATISLDTIKWMKASSNLFYAWHWYGMPKQPADAVKDVLAIQKKWDMPSFVTETMSCDVFNDAKAAGISHSYWHYSAYCDTGAPFGNKHVPDQTFGACILGWGAGHPTKCVNASRP
eukprot:g4056.t1